MDISKPTPNAPRHRSHSHRLSAIPEAATLAFGLIPLALFVHHVLEASGMVPFATYDFVREHSRPLFFVGCQAIPLVLATIGSWALARRVTAGGEWGGPARATLLSGLVFASLTAWTMRRLPSVGSVWLFASLFFAIAAAICLEMAVRRRNGPLASVARIAVQVGLTLLAAVWVYMDRAVLSDYPGWLPI